jgi:4-alpha-glucanotransferase
MRMTRALFDVVRLDQFIGFERYWAIPANDLASVADTAIIPVQDLLGLASSARMNRPGAHAGNWEWRAATGAASPTLAHELATLTRTYSRQQRRTPRPTT